MASLASTTALPKVLRSPWSSRVYVPVTRRHFQASSRKEASTGLEEAKKTGQDVKNKAASATDDVVQKTKEAAGEVSKTAQDLTEKAKQTAQDAWGSVKDTTQKIKEKVVGKAEESKEFIKENADGVKRSMNSKN